MSLTRLTSIVAAAVFGFTANAALAQQGYGTLSYFDWEAGQSDGPTIESETVRAVGGYMFNDVFGIEGHVASGGTDKDFQFQGEEGDSAKLNKAVGAFAKLNAPLPLIRGANVFGLVGYSYGRVDVQTETTVRHVNENSFSWGAGADVAIIPERLHLTADYVRYIGRSGIDLDATSVGLRLDF